MILILTEEGTGGVRARLNLLEERLREEAERERWYLHIYKYKYKYNYR